MRRVNGALFQPLELLGGLGLKNRIVKAALSDSPGDGRGDPTAAQARLYERWAEGGAALAEDRQEPNDLPPAVADYEARDAARAPLWRSRFDT
ncbi:hypothetical protein [Algicella marina]|uniref:hypothetical protein n=1 Tax=Algicella marina TaxID=2683284 RepID=UPI0032AF541A